MKCFLKIIQFGSDILDKIVTIDGLDGFPNLREIDLAKYLPNLNVDQVMKQLPANREKAEEKAKKKKAAKKKAIAAATSDLEARLALAEKERDEAKRDRDQVKKELDESKKQLVEAIKEHDAKAKEIADLQVELKALKMVLNNKSNN